MRSTADFTEPNLWSASSSTCSGPEANPSQAISFTSRVAYSASGLAKDLIGRHDQLSLLYGTSLGSSQSTKIFNGTPSQPPPAWTYLSPHPISRNAKHQDTSSTSFRTVPSGNSGELDVNDFLQPKRSELSDDIDQISITERCGEDATRSWETFDENTLKRACQDQNIPDEEYQRILTHANSAIKSGQNHSGESRSCASYIAEETHGCTTSDHLSINRLNMILRHVTKDAHAWPFLRNSVQSHQSLSREQALNVTRNLENISGSSSAPGSTSTCSISTPTASMFPRLRPGINNHVDTGEGTATASVNCSRVACRKRFEDLDSLRPYPGARWGYRCPHEDCSSQFQTYQHLAEHIARPHHGHK